MKVEVWRGWSLRERIRDRFGVRYSESGMYFLLHRLGFSSLMPRPVHPDGDSAAHEEFKKTLPRTVALFVQSHPDVALEVWFEDEARFGQIGILSRLWTMRGEWALALRPLGYEWTCLFGSVCPMNGKAHGLLLPYADLESMRYYSEDFSRSLPSDVFALLICDRAGWHTSGRLCIPNTVLILHLPPKSPELNPVELLWRKMRQKHLGNRVFPNVEHMCKAVIKAWNQVIENP